jgi:hypothetical protein
MKTFKEYINEEKSQDAYDRFFQKMLNKWNVDAPDELSDEEKKKFFDAVDKGWKADNESD